jgi:hypothetical protein
VTLGVDQGDVSEPVGVDLSPLMFLLHKGVAKRGLQPLRPCGVRVILISNIFSARDA